MRAATLLVSVLALGACHVAGAHRGESTEGDHADAAPATGTGAQRSFQVGSFDSVSLGGHHNVVVTVGGAPSVRAEGDERELERLEITVRGSELHIGSRDTNGFSFRRRPALTIHVTLPALAKASIGGSGDMRIDNVQGRSFDASIGGSGSMQIASLRVESAKFSIGGSGSIRAEGGQAQSTDISIAGSGDVDLSRVESRTADVSVVGSGDVGIRASEEADVSVMGSGDVNVAGRARCRINKMGSGDVRCEA